MKIIKLRNIIVRLQNARERSNFINLQKEKKEHIHKSSGIKMEPDFSTLDWKQECD